jgi:DNA adenine methylase
VQAHPVIKWAGGKTQLIPTLLSLFLKKPHTYYEPFLGGGAVFFEMAARKKFERAVLNDQNADLVNVYRVVRDFPDDLMEALTRLEQTYVTSPQETYASIRTPEGDMARRLEGPVGRAARFIFLNKAGFNGLYRVNRKGDFNVPWGKRERVKTFEKDNIRACQDALNGAVSLLNGDFVDAVPAAKEGDLVYLDPPYVPLNPTSSFTTYTQEGFGLKDQQRLALCFRELTERGVAVVLSNSDTPLVRQLYEGFEIHPIQVKRAINSKGDKRGPVGEVIVVNRRVSMTTHPNFPEPKRENETGTTSPSAPSMGGQLIDEA